MIKNGETEGLQIQDGKNMLFPIHTSYLKKKQALRKLVEN